jgi:hypothetical protein
MMTWLRLISLFVVFVLLGPPAWSQDVERWDRYLDRPRGPYQGQVIDAETKAPLVGAVVVVHWLRDHVDPIHIVAENYAVRETVTDREGRFLMDAKDVEEGAPRRTRRPEFLIFQPGYGKYPGNQMSPKGFTGGVFERAGTVVELPRLAGREERRKQLFLFDPHSYSDSPFKELPELVRRFNVEREAIGFEPLSSPE